MSLIPFLCLPRMSAKCQRVWAGHKPVPECLSAGSYWS